MPSIAFCSWPVCCLLIINKYNWTTKMALNKIKKAIEDSKRKKQFRLRAKDRGERKDKKE